MPDFALDHVVIAVRTSTPPPRTMRRCSAANRRGAASIRSTARRTRSSASTTPTSSCSRSAPARATSAGRASSRFFQNSGEGLFALALGTSDVNAAVRELRDNGLDVLDPSDGDGIDLISGGRRGGATPRRR